MATFLKFEKLILGRCLIQHKSKFWHNIVALDKMVHGRGWYGSIKAHLIAVSSMIHGRIQRGGEDRGQSWIPSDKTSGIRACDI